MHPTPYRELNELLTGLVAGVRAALGPGLVGAYLQGGFALGSADRDSDVDFIMVAQDELTNDEVRVLQQLHARVYDLPCPWAQHLEGSYFPRATLQPLSRSGELLWYLEHGDRSLTRSAHCNTLVDRWVLRTHGIILAGPDPATLVEPIPVELLRQGILREIRGWGREILDNPDRFHNRFYQSFIVLSYCRMLHDLQAGRISSKRAGTEWAKANVDPSWSGLIDRAWDGRPDPARSVRQPANPEEFRLTLEFVQYMIDLADGASQDPGA
jgi:hypothetical protein